jgi:DNA-binding response OmpR family regulator
MLTTEGSRDAIIKAIKAGATAYMTKPFFEKDLAAKMLDCLGMGFE